MPSHHKREGEKTAQQAALPATNDELAALKEELNEQNDQLVSALKKLKAAEERIVVLETSPERLSVVIKNNRVVSYRID